MATTKAVESKSIAIPENEEKKESHSGFTKTVTMAEVGISLFIIYNVILSII